MRSIFVLSSILTVSVHANANEPARPTGNPAVAASNAFACDLFRKLSETSADKSILFSPYSISTALAMTLDGARGETAAEMAKVLRLRNPGQTIPYCEGFKTIADRLRVDPVRGAADRKKLADWRAELAKVNKTIEELQRQGKFNQLGVHNDRAIALVDSINKLMPQVDPFDLRVANALWGDKSHPFAAPYLASVDRMFGAGNLRLADFRNNYPAERAVINRWVEQQTNDRIKDLLPTLSPDEAQLLRLVLINAIYFKGEWSQPFDLRNTVDDDFRLATGQKLKTKMMSQSAGEGQYAAFNGDGSFFNTPGEVPVKGGLLDKGEAIATYPGDSGFLMAELPMKGNRISLVFLAPQNVGGLPALEAKLTGPNLVAWLGKLRRRQMYVTLPRYKLETEYELGQALEGMGMRSAFSNGADFSGMTASLDPNDRLRISRVIHKAFVEVNEKGAEAAAATAVMMVPLSAAPIRELTTPFVPEFRGDRPFLFLIRDTDSGMILFLGRVTRPG
jgi:serpin B